MQILIIQTAFLGDVILSTALIEKLKVYYPNSRIDILIKKGNEHVLKDHPKLRYIFTFDKKKKIGSIWELYQKFRTIKYDLTINVHRHFSSGLITLLSGAKKKIGFKKNPLSFLYNIRIKHIWEKHEVERNQSLITSLTDEFYAKPRLYPSESDCKTVQTLTEIPFITISPASVWNTKELPLERWTDLIGNTPENIRIYLMGGPSDVNKCVELKSLVLHRNVEVLAGKFSFLQDAALMSKALMNYVLDSGPMHICSAMNAPVTAVFCSTTPGFGFGPLSDISITVETAENLDCRPCGPHGHKKCPKGHFKCSDIKLEPLT